MPFMQFGWGERNFYLNTPEWKDLTVSTALNAMLLPSRTAVHVTYWGREPSLEESRHKLLVTPEELAKLETYIKQSLALSKAGAHMRIAGAHYHDSDVFYEGQGSYHLFRTCNNWTNTGLKNAGLPAVVWSPFDLAILHRLKR